MHEQRPDVVLIFMDDMTHWALRSDSVRTPNLDRLRRRGMTFTHAFNQGSMDEAVCMPARQMLISGLSLFHAAERFMDVPHLGQALSAAGYDSFFTGKWHNEEEALQADYRTVGPWAGGMLHASAIGGDGYFRPRLDDTWDPTDTTRGGHWMTLPDGSVQHSSERWTDAAVAFIGSDHSDMPYFLHLAYHAPHDPRQIPAEFLAQYSDDDITIPPNFLAEHPFDNGGVAVRDEMLAPTPRTPDAVRLHRREYFAILTHVDDQIGRLLDAIEAAESPAGTVVVFSGDHGLALGEHGLLGKQNPYDHSIRVPLVISGPGVPAGASSDALVYSGSIFPTILDLVALPAPTHLEFPSLRPLLCADSSDDFGQDVIFGAYKDVQRLVRTSKYKLIEYRDPQNNQLFDVEADPWERTNLYGSQHVDEAQRELARRLKHLQIALDDPLGRGFAEGAPAQEVSSMQG